MAIKEALIDRKGIRIPFPASTANAVGDLLFWDNSNKFGKQASARTDLGSAALNQADFTPLFLGVAADQRLSTETSVTTVASLPVGPSDRMVITEGVFDCDCASATFEIGDLVGVARDSGNSINLNQTVVGVATSNLAIGMVVKREPTAVTKVRCYLSALQYGWFKTGVAGKQANYQYVTGTTTTTFAAGQLTGASILNVYNSTATTPGSIATRTATQMFGDIAGAYVGMQFVTRIINSSGSANTMTVTAGSGVTLSGTTTHTIAQFAYRDYLITFTSATAATMVAVGGGAAATN